MSSLFYNLGKMVGPRVRKVKWIWQSITASEADAIQAEHKVGQDLAREIRNRLELDTEPRAGQMLNKVGRHLTACVANKLRTFSFEVIKGTEPNAFALPGGFIFVTRSLLELCGWNQDEVAFILGHEMGHVIRGHAMDRIITNSAIAVGAKAAPIRGLLASWLRGVGMKVVESAYSQDLELEADTLGARLAAAAGYDPHAPIQLLSRLSELSQPAKQFSLGNYFSSHPAFDVRIHNMCNGKEQKALRIRVANERDICELVFLENECFNTYYKRHRFSKAHFARYLENNQTIFLVAILNSSIIGYVAGSVRASKFKSSARLDSIAVSPPSRKRGIGSQLMKCFIEKAEQRACTTVVLEVAVTNKNGVFFFTKQGFEKIRAIPAYYGEGLDGILMKLYI